MRRTLAVFSIALVPALAGLPASCSSSSDQAAPEGGPDAENETGGEGAPSDSTPPPSDGAADADAANDAALLGDASPPSSTQVVAHFASPLQTMDGFGASESFIPTITDGQADLFFSTTKGIGLSILRMGIAPTGHPYSGSWATAQKALARNPSLVVWGAPWSPPAANKTTNNTTTGSIVAADYASWASVLAGFVGEGAQNGVTVAAISAQNEPDYNTNGAYDMCLYDQNQMTSFVKALGPALAALKPPSQLIMPEPSVWGHLWGGGLDYVDTVMADSTAASFVDIVATHQYSVPDPPMHALPMGKRFWETEVSDFGGFDPSIGNAVTVASWIHNAIVDGGVNAWHYWWLVNQNQDNEGLIGKGGDGSLTKRVYAMGNFSLFVRPGWTRLTTSGAVNGLLVTAYADRSTGDFAFVAINTTGGPVMASMGLSGPVFSSVVPYVTSGTGLGNLGSDGNLSVGSASASLPATINASMNAFSALVPPGVVTFVGKGH